MMHAESRAEGVAVSSQRVAHLVRALASNPSICKSTRS